MRSYFLRQQVGGGQRVPDLSIEKGAVQDGAGGGILILVDRSSLLAAGSTLLRWRAERKTTTPVLMGLLFQRNGGGNLQSNGGEAGRDWRRYRLPIGVSTAWVSWVSFGIPCTFSWYMSTPLSFSVAMSWEALEGHDRWREAVLPLCQHSRSFPRWKREGKVRRCTSSIT